MKVVFNGPINSQDTILMHLYKRVFPKWTYDPQVAAPAALYRPAALHTVTEAARDEHME